MEQSRGLIKKGYVRHVMSVEDMLEDVVVGHVRLDSTYGKLGWLVQAELD